MLWARGSTIVSRARRTLNTQVYCSRRKEGRGNIRLVYLDRFLCVLPECCSTNQIAVSGNQHKEHLNIKCSKCTLVVFTIEAVRAWQSFLHVHVFY